MTRGIQQIVEELSKGEYLTQRFHSPHHIDVPMPSLDELKTLLEMLRSVIFPGYYGNSELNEETIIYYIGSTLDKCHAILSEQMLRGFCFSCIEESRPCTQCYADSKTASQKLFERLPAIRDILLTDVQAAYDGDPAARSLGEVIFAYPSIRALTHHRIAHELYLLNVPIIPRLISEMAHSETGIDIHPGATIGKSFFIDHGTGTVIGETAVIGDNVRIYQGVTLGAKSFPKDEHGNPIKGIPRHPIVEDNVIIYAGATVLGRITIGAGTVIGGNTWVTKDTSPGEQISQRKPNHTG